MRLLMVLLVFFSASSFAQESVPKGDGWVTWPSNNPSSKFYCSGDRECLVPVAIAGSCGQSVEREEWIQATGFSSTSWGCQGRNYFNGNAINVLNISMRYESSAVCPESHPIDNGDGTCSLPPPELPEDCPIGTKLSIGLGQLGDGSPPVCEPFSCPVGGANVTIPTQFFEVDFGSPSFAFCDGSCAYTVSTGSGGSVNAYASGLACGNGTSEYVYAAPTFDSQYCTGGDDWVDCSDDPQRVDEDNPITSYDPVSPEDIDVPLEEQPDYTPEPLPDCTAETALSGGCFVNSMDAVQTNIAGSISTSQSQQTDRVVKSITALINSNREGMTGLGDKLAKTIEESRRASALPFLTQQFAGTENPEPVPMTIQEAATGLDFDADGWNFSDLIPTATKTLGWNPSDYQFGVGGGLCPEPTVLVIGGQNISLDWSMFCDMAVIINAFLIAMAYFIGGNIIMRAF